MKIYETANIRNIAVIGHGDSGKTTLVSAMLFRAGTVNYFGKITTKNTVTDFDEEEKERGISISTAVAYCEWKNQKINILDTPGYSNFIPDAKAGLRVADSALMAISGADGAQVQTERVWDWALEYNIPVLFVINLLDRDRASFETALASVKKAFGKSVIPLTLPIGEGASYRGYVNILSGLAFEYPKDESGKAKQMPAPNDMKDAIETHKKELVEKIAEMDDALMEKYLETGNLTAEEIAKGLKKGFVNREIFPVLNTAGLLNIGADNVLDTIVDICPAPAENGSARTYIAVVKKGEASEERPISVKEPFSAYVFKTIADPYAGKISLFRVFSSTLKGDAAVVNATKGEKEKFGSAFLVQGKEHFAVPEVHAGDIAGVAKLRVTETGDTLADPAFSVRYPVVKFPEPIISFAVEPKSKTDEDKLSTILRRLEEADPMLKIHRDPQTLELLLSGTGQLHIEATISRMKRLANLEVILHPPKVPYRETIKRISEARFRHKKQTGGRGQFAECQIRLEPLPRDQEFEFVDDIFGGSIPSNYVPAVEKGVQEARQKGYLAGYPVVNFRVVLFDGMYHEVDSSEIAFKIASSKAFKKAMEGASPVLLEPVMNVEIMVPEEFIGDIMGDLNSRRGRVQGMDSRGALQTIRAQVPMSEILNYAATLKSITRDRGTFTLEFSHYDEVPFTIQEKIVQQAKAQKEEEAEED